MFREPVNSASINSSPQTFQTAKQSHYLLLKRTTAEQLIIPVAYDLSSQLVAALNEYVPLCEKFEPACERVQRWLRLTHELNVWLKRQVVVE